MKISMDIGYSVLPPVLHWKLDPYRAETELSWFNLVNIMSADALAPYVARILAAMILSV